jgi:RNA polymerase nonessential primary-like sigma factor
MHKLRGYTIRTKSSIVSSHGDHSGSRFVKSVSLTAQQEAELSDRAQRFLDEARVLLQRTPAAAQALKKNPSPDGLAVSLPTALHAVPAGAERTKIRSLLQRADTLHWKLALSGASLLRWEAARIRAPRAERDDIIQHGYIGLLKAARRFEPARKLRFSTYARWWVRAQMQEAMASHGRLVRLPASANEALGRLMPIIEARREAGLPVTAEALSEDVDVSARQIRLLLRQGAVHSMEEEVGGVPLSDTLSVSPRCEDALIKHEQLRRCRTAFKDLTPREQEILSRHFGLSGYKKESLTAIGRTIDLSRERVRQLEKLSLQSMAAHVA